MGLRERIFGNKDDKAFEFSAAAAQTDLANPNNNASQQDYIDTVGRVGYLLDSPTMHQFFIDNAELRPLIPAFQNVIRTTKISRREGEVMWLGFKILTLKMKADLAATHPHKDYTAIFMAVELLFESVITDATDAMAALTFNQFIGKGIKHV